MWPFSMKIKIADKPDVRSREKKNLDFWRNEYQTLFLKGGNEIIVLRGRDIEVCWIDAHGEKPYAKGEDGGAVTNPLYREKSEYLIRTRSGGVYALTDNSWLKCRFEDPDFNI